MQMEKARLTAYLNAVENGEVKLRSCIALYQSTGEAAFREYALAHMDKSSGMSLLFAWEQTGGPAYRQAMDALMADLPAAADPEALYQFAPFHAAYDVRFGGRKDARRIAAAFQTMQDALSDPWYYLALVDCIEQMDIQLYEHYRVLADLILRAAQARLRQPALNAADCCLLMKGVRLGLLDPEKYLPPALKSCSTLAWDYFYPLALAEYGRINA